MKFLTALLTIFSLSLIVSCGSDDSDPGTSVNSEMTATITHKQLETDLTVTTLGTYTMTADEIRAGSGLSILIMGTEGTSGVEGYRRVLLEIVSSTPSTVSTGTYTIDDTWMVGSVRADFLSRNMIAESYEDLQDPIGDLSVTISSYNQESQLISGSFSGELVASFTDEFVEISGSFKDIPLIEE